MSKLGEDFTTACQVVFADKESAKNFISKRISPVFYDGLKSKLPNLAMERTNKFKTICIDVQKGSLVSSEFNNN